MPKHSKKHSKNKSKLKSKKQNAKHLEHIKIENRKIPNLESFKKTFHFDDLRYYKKTNKYKYPESITDADIIKYIKSLGDLEYQNLMYDITEVETYSSMPDKINFQPVNIEWVRKNLWNPKTRSWRPYYYYYSNGDNPNNPHYGPVMVQDVANRTNRDKVFCNEFTFDGDLIEKKMKNGMLEDVKIHKGWLHSKEPGPYKWKNYNYVNKRRFYFLSGTGQFCGDKSGTRHNYPLQICQCNLISDNCINCLNWIEYKPS